MLSINFFMFVGATTVLIGSVSGVVISVWIYRTNSIFISKHKKQRPMYETTKDDK